MAFLMRHAKTSEPAEKRKACSNMASPSADPVTVPWSFEDGGTEVVVTLDVPSVKAAAFDVQISGDSLTVEVTESDKKTDLLRITQLYSTIDAASSEWKLSPSKNSLTVRLKKLDPDSTWPQLEAKSSTKEAPISHGDPLEARKAVEALLSAARAGDVEAFKGAAQRFDGSDLSGVKDANGRNALHFSASHGQTDFVNLLVSEEHFEVDASDDSGWCFSF